MQPLRALLVCRIGCVLTEAAKARSNIGEHDNARDTAAATGKNSHVDGGDTDEERTEEQYDSDNSGLRSDGSGYGRSAFRYGHWGRRKSATGLGFGLPVCGNGMGSGDDKAAISGHGGDIGAESNSPRSGAGCGGMGHRGFGGFNAGRRKRVTAGYFGATGVRPGSFSSDLALDSEFPIGGRGFGKQRTKRDGRSVGGKVVASSSQRTGVEYGGVIGSSGRHIGRRRRRVRADENRGDTGGRQGDSRSGLRYMYGGYGGFGGMGGYRSMGGIGTSTTI